MWTLGSATKCGLRRVVINIKGDHGWWCERTFRIVNPLIEPEHVGEQMVDKDVDIVLSADSVLEVDESISMEEASSKLMAELSDILRDWDKIGDEETHTETSVWNVETKEAEHEDITKDWE